MRISIFGLTITSSWGNGHATLWRALCRALVARGHRVTFFERDVPYYHQHRDLRALEGVEICLYSKWSEVEDLARQRLNDSDVGLVTSYCADGPAASALVLDSRAAVKIFYDLDTPVTLDRLARGEVVEYLPAEGLGRFDLTLSFTGGRALTKLREELGARCVAPLYGSVDPAVHAPTRSRPEYRADLSYLGTYAADRQAKFEELFLAPARARPDRRFTLAGACFPSGYDQPGNVKHFTHLAPAEHAAFFGSSRLTLNLTRAAMADFGFCPSGRLFEAAASGVPLISDRWEGIETFFTPDEEIRLVATTEDVGAAIDTTDAELRRRARAARERVLSKHTAAHRVLELEELIERAKPHPTGGSSAGGLRWGIVPAAGAGTRIQPLAFSKELLPVGSRVVDGVERPRAVSEFLIERMIAGGANRLCFVISPGKGDIFEYYRAGSGAADLCYVVQPRPAGLCDALFRAGALIHPGDVVMIGLPDTIWFPEDGFARLPDDELSFLLFKVDRPENFDAVVTDARDRVLEIQVKTETPTTDWIWGAFQLPGYVFLALRDLWISRDRRDTYVGTLINAYLTEGGRARAVRAGERYVDVGTLHGYREALQLLNARVVPTPTSTLEHRTTV